MSAQPSADVLSALRSAAVQTGVPLSLLWGIAFAESGFDPSKTGPITRSGERARGLMQLMPNVLAKYSVSDPFNAAQSALGGAKYLLALAKPLKWNVADMLSAYVWGPTAFARARATGQSIPSEVTTYVKRALAARDVYRNQADRPRGTLVIALNDAIENLSALNPSWAPATMARDAWRPFFAARASDPDSMSVLNPALKSLWRSYALAYERAPITDTTTPRPELVEPDFWAKAVRVLDHVKKAAEDTAIGLGAGVFVVALFWFAVSSRRR